MEIMSVFIASIDHFDLVSMDYVLNAKKGYISSHANSVFHEWIDHESRSLHVIKKEVDTY